MQSNEVFRAYKWLRKYNQFPFPGGWMEQSARFINTVEFIDLIESTWAAMIKKRNKATEDLIGKMNRGSKHR